MTLVLSGGIAVHMSGGWCWLLAGDSFVALGKNACFYPFGLDLFTAWKLGNKSKHPKSTRGNCIAISWPSPGSHLASLLPDFPGWGCHKVWCSFKEGVSMAHCKQNVLDGVHCRGHLWKIQSATHSLFPLSKYFFLFVCVCVWLAPSCHFNHFLVINIPIYEHCIYLKQYPHF